MNQEESTLSIKDFQEIALRRKWFIIFPFFLVMSVAITLCLVLPKIYRASTTILVIPQEVPDDLIRSTVTMNPSEYLNVITQEIMSRTRLEKIINELSLFSEIISDLSMEEIVELMRKRIDIAVQSNPRSSLSSFTISYEGKAPQEVAETANRIAALFIEENLKSREQQARKTTAFLSDELEKLKIILEKHENEISTFKQSYLGSLPEQREANLRMLDQLILQRQRISDELNDVQNRKIIIQQQLIQTDAYVPAGSEGQHNLYTNSILARIEETQKKLTELQNKYTEKHPDVIALKAALDKLVVTSQVSNGDADAQKESTYPVGDPIASPVLPLNLQIKTLQDEDKLIQSKIAEYQTRVEMAPKLEQQLSSLMRNYQNTKDSYDVLMTKRLAAQQAEKLEMNKQGEQFKVLDPAKIPHVPFKPDKRKILLIGFMLALAAGCGLGYFLETLDKSFHTTKDVESYLELPVLIAIPTMNIEKNMVSNLPIRGSTAR